MKVLLLLFSTLMTFNSLQASMKLEVFDNPNCQRPFFSFEVTGNTAIDKKLCRFAVANRPRAGMGSEVGSVRFGSGPCQNKLFSLAALCSRLETSLEEARPLHASSD